MELTPVILHWPYRICGNLELRIGVLCMGEDNCSEDGVGVCSYIASYIYCKL
jgi:hypothetical protein